MIQKSVASVVVALCLVGCHRAPSNQSATDKGAHAAHAVAQTPLAEVRKIVETKSATVLDANGDDTRKEYGVIPGATLLSSSDHYALSELPQNKSARLVFYCGGTQCRASDHAAERAAENGYTQVSVMREGIRGWKASGAPTQPLPQS